MISFKNDYSEGAHPRVLEALIRTNLEQAVDMEKIHILLRLMKE